MSKTQAPPHRWSFFRSGGFDQVKLERGADLMALDQLDLNLWVALACPTSGLEFDKATLSMMDTDKDGRIRAPELIAAVKWACSMLQNPDDLLKGAAALPVSAINQSNPEGKQLADFSAKVLSKTLADEITVEEAATAALAFAAKPFNGDGIITVDSATDPAIKEVIQQIIDCVGADVDASGKPGVGQPKIDQFFTEAQAYSDWWKKVESDPTILPLGLETADVAATIKAVETKLNDFFVRCHFAAFDSRALNALNREEKDFAAVAAKDLSACSAELASFPLARVQANAVLPLKSGINPAWAAAINAFHAKAIKPLLGDKDSLSESEWNSLVAKFAAYQAWRDSKKGGAIEKLGLSRVREVLASDARQKLSALVCLDKAEHGNSQGAIGLNRLTLYYRDLNRLCHNFVSFRDFYGRKRKAIFQAGTLYLDQRACDLCLIVEDAGKHATMAGLAGTFLAYCDCVRKGTGQKLQIVAAFTDGDSDNIMVGRNGIFFDRKGCDWDATITKIIDNPISIRQAFFSPYKKFVRIVEEQVAKRAAAAEAATTAQLQAAAAATTPAVPVPPAAPVAKQKIDTGTLAAIGLVLTTLMGALGSIFGQILGLPWWQIPLALVAIMLSISAPPCIMAYLKLRRRNLGPILDANGWAINARAKMNVPFGGSLTRVATLPAGSQRDLVDPFAEKKSQWPKVVVIVFVLILGCVLLDKMGYIYEWTNGRLGTPRVLIETTPKAPAQETTTK